MKNKDQAKGRVEQAVADLTGNDEMKRRGKADEKAGDTKVVIEKVKDKVEHLVDTVKDRVTEH